MHCWEVAGDLANLQAVLTECAWSAAGPPTANAVSAWLNGLEHQIFLRPSGTSSQPLPVSVLCSAGYSPARLWVWAHPAAAAELEGVLQRAAKHRQCNFQNLSRHLLRFRLRGPGATTVLARSLKLVETKKRTTARSGSAASEPMPLQTPENVAACWQLLTEHLTHPAQLTSGSVLSMVVWDPRLQPVRAKAKEKTAAAPAPGLNRQQMRKLVEVGGICGGGF